MICSSAGAAFSSLSGALARLCAAGVAYFRPRYRGLNNANIDCDTFASERVWVLRSRCGDVHRRPAPVRANLSSFVVRPYFSVRCSLRAARHLACTPSQTHDESATPCACAKRNTRRTMPLRSTHNTANRDAHAKAAPGCTPHQYFIDRALNGAADGSCGRARCTSLATVWTAQNEVTEALAAIVPSTQNLWHNHSHTLLSDAEKSARKMTARALAYPLPEQSPTRKH